MIARIIFTCSLLIHFLFTLAQKTERIISFSGYEWSGLLAMPVHINFWLFDGNPPADQNPVEIVIRSFQFSP